MGLGVASLGLGRTPGDDETPDVDDSGGCAKKRERRARIKPCVATWPDVGRLVSAVQGATDVLS